MIVRTRDMVHAVLTRCGGIDLSGACHVGFVVPEEEGERMTSGRIEAVMRSRGASPRALRLLPFTRPSSSASAVKPREALGCGDAGSAEWRGPSSSTLGRATPSSLACL
ncbi:hypothetical protein [Sphingomonas corticis]|uniref:Uncharacterized protein n=1 Tax=Sphingomonas corticis TaxID=2722791 RepID=A0ABX1CQ12_9SPHN|nr:hypothetical protein [Sphingomonas corticis]NJR80038.1 hypothetical protein [Sphingomonas corticis]